MNSSSLRSSALITIGAFLFGHACFVLLPDVLQMWNARAIDLFFQIRSSLESTRPLYDDTIVHVDITNHTVQNISRLTREHDAMVVRNLSSFGVAAQLHDYIYPNLSDSLSDQALIAALRQTENVYFGLAFEQLTMSHQRLSSVSESRVAEGAVTPTWHLDTDSGSPIPSVAKPFVTVPQIASVSSGLGFLNVVPDADGVYRRVPLLGKSGDSYFPSLTLLALCNYLDVPSENIRLNADSIVLEGANSRDQGGPHDIIIPLDSDGLTIVNFIGAWDRMKHYDYLDVLEAGSERFMMDIWRDELDGKIVVISNSATGTADVGTVPTDTAFPLSGLIANMAHSILTGDFLRSASTSLNISIEICLLLALLGLARRRSLFTFLFGSLVSIAVCLVLSYGLFVYGHLVVNVVRPVLLMTSCLAMTVLYRYVNEEKEKAVLHSAFSAYFPPAVVEKVTHSPDSIIASAGQRKNLTIMFTDIVGFSSYCNTCDPALVKLLLNEYFEVMIEIVFRYGGTIEKFTGDGLMVFFGDPEEQPDHGLRGVRTAIEMQKAVHELKARWEADGKMPIQIRIGINTGDVIVGNMGSEKRMTYTVIGSAANLAQRLESSAPAGGILISSATREELGDKVSLSESRTVEVKGFDKPITVYEVLHETDL